MRASYRGDTQRTELAAVRLQRATNLQRQGRWLASRQTEQLASGCGLSFLRAQLASVGLQLVEAGAGPARSGLSSPSSSSGGCGFLLFSLSQPGTPPLAVSPLLHSTFFPPAQAHKWSEPARRRKSVHSSELGWLGWHSTAPMLGWTSASQCACGRRPRRRRVGCTQVWDKSHTCVTL